MLIPQPLLSYPLLPTQGALHTCRLVSSSLCCHLVVTGPAMRSAWGSGAPRLLPTPSPLSLKTFLWWPCLRPLSVFLLWGPLVPPASHKGLLPLLPTHT